MQVFSIKNIVNRLKQQVGQSKIYISLHRRQRMSKGQLKMDNPEKPATRQRKTKQKHNNNEETR